MDRCGAESMLRTMGKFFTCRTWNFVDFHLHSIHQHGAIQLLGSTIVQADVVGPLWWILGHHRPWQWQITIQAYHQSCQWHPCHCSWPGRTTNQFREGPQSEIILFLFTHKPFQCVCNWFANYASGNAKERPGKLKSDTRGHLTSTKAWTAKLVCGYILSEEISEEQISLSRGGEKDIGKYHAALTKIFSELEEDNLKKSEELAIKWNTQSLPDNVQWK